MARTETVFMHCDECGTSSKRTGKTYGTVPGWAAVYYEAADETGGLYAFDLCPACSKKLLSVIPNAVRNEQAQRHLSVKEQDKAARP